MRHHQTFDYKVLRNVFEIAGGGGGADCNQTLGGIPTAGVYSSQKLLGFSGLEYPFRVSVHCTSVQ